MESLPDSSDVGVLVLGTILADYFEHVAYEDQELRDT